MRRLKMKNAFARLKEHRRKGVFFVLAVVSLMATMAFVGWSVDLGMITVTQTRMQSAADAAAPSVSGWIEADFTSVGNNLNTLTSGIVSIHILYSEVPV